MSLVEDGNISTNDQRVNRKKYDSCPLWANMKKGKNAPRKHTKQAKSPSTRA